MINDAEINKRFDHHPPGDSAIRRHKALRSAFKDTATAINVLVPDSREKALAITNLEGALMWANAGIARNQDD